MSQATRVLLVEDDQTDAALFSAPLGHSQDFDATHVTSLESALEALGAPERTPPPFDVVLLDLGLPDSRFEETFLRLVEVAPDIPVVVLTGHDDEEVALTALSQGAQDYLVKHDVTEVLLSKAVVYAIERHRSGRSRRHRHIQELGVYESLIGTDAALSADEVEDLGGRYRALVEMVRSAGELTPAVDVQVDQFVVSLADVGAGPVEIAAVHTAALADLQTFLDQESFADAEDAAGLVLLRTTGGLALDYRRRGVSPTDDAASPEAEPLPADARPRILAAVTELLETQEVAALTVRSVAEHTDLPVLATLAAIDDLSEPVAIVLHKELERQGQVAEVLLAPDRWAGTSLDHAVAGTVESLVELWRSGAVQTRSAIAVGAGNPVIGDVRYMHLRTLGERAVAGLAPYLESDELDRGRQVMAELFAVLDQKLLLGELYPTDESRDGALATLTGICLDRLRPGHRVDPQAVSEVEAAEAPVDASSAPPPADESPTEPAADQDSPGRRLTEADYAAWARRMRTRRRSEIDDLFGPGVEPEPEAGDDTWSADRLFEG